MMALFWKGSIRRPLPMVERKVLGLNSRDFLASVMSFTGRHQNWWEPSRLNCNEREEKKLFNIAQVLKVIRE